VEFITSLKISKFYQSILIYQARITIFFWNPGNWLFFEILKVGFACDLYYLFVDYVFVIEFDKDLLLALFHIYFRVIKRANLMKPVHDHEVAFALKNEWFELSGV
jgi:hypothetical protein